MIAKELPCLLFSMGAEIMDLALVINPKRKLIEDRTMTLQLSLFFFEGGGEGGRTLSVV